MIVQPRPGTRLLVCVVAVVTLTTTGLVWSTAVNAFSVVVLPHHQRQQQLSNKPYHVSAIISTRLFSDNCNMKDETVSTDEESRIAIRRILSQQPTISDTTKTTTATNNNNTNTLDTTVHVRIPGQAFIIVLAVTLFWPTLAGVRIWWNNHNHNHPAAATIQTRTFQSRPSKPSLSTNNNNNNNNNHNLPNFDQRTIPSKSLAPKEPPSSSAGLLDDNDDSSDDNERNNTDEILELPRLSPAEQIVGAVFRPPTGKKQYGQ